MEKDAKNRIKKFKFRRYHYLAIELRYQGRTYKEIAENLTSVFKIGVSPSRVGHWFATKGILEQPYIDFAKKENERLRRFIGEEVKKLLPRIPKVLEGLLSRTDDSGQPDATVLATVRLLCDILDLKACMQEDSKTNSSILDEYFSRLEERFEHREGPC